AVRKIAPINFFMARPPKMTGVTNAPETFRNMPISRLTFPRSPHPRHGDPRPVLILRHELGLGQRDDGLYPGFRALGERVSRRGAQALAGHFRRALDEAFFLTQRLSADHRAVTLKLEDCAVHLSADHAPLADQLRWNFSRQEQLKRDERNAGHEGDA